MIHRIVHRLLGYGYIERKFFDQAMHAKNEVIADNKRLKAELLGKEEALRRSVKVIDANIGDVEPTDTKARAAYVASASNFYTEILEKKMLQMIATVRDELDSVVGSTPYGMTRFDHDNFLRGTTNAFKLLMDWGEQMKGEHLSNIKPNEE